MPRHRHVPIAGRSLHVVESGDPHGPPFLLLHGWPESWRAWEGVMRAAGDGARLIAVDLPGIGGSTGPVPGGSKRELAEVVRGLVRHLGLDGLTLVGHDVGGMVAYAYLRRYDDLARTVIMDTTVPGVDPWDEVLRDPHVWHFGLHAVPGLPETLVRGRQAEYFGFFFDALARDPRRISARSAHAAAYRDDTALTAGFDLYRAFARDAEDNAAFARRAPATSPLLYLRGGHVPGDVEASARGFRAAGVRHVTTATVPDAGHFTPEEAPERVWELVRDARSPRPAP